MSQGKIVICDDEEGVRESLKLILEDQYNLIITDSAAQCWDCLNNDESIRLVLLDIKMPKVNGLDTLSAIHESHPDIKVIIITGYKSVETASEAAQRGACGYIVKPFKSNEILDVVKREMG